MITPVTEPRRGDPVAADTIAQIIREVRANRINPGVGYTYSRGPGGTSLTIDRPEPAPGPGPEALARACPAMITGGSATAGYTITLYADGLTNGATGTGIFFTPEAASDSTVDLPAGTAVIAHPIDTIITGGT